MNIHNLPNDEEIKKFYTLFCVVFTAFHNYATAKRLFQNKIYSWSLTSYYYSLMHCGRSIYFMSLNCYPKRHDVLHDFLSGKDINNKKFWKLRAPKGIKESHNFSELINRLPQINRSNKSRIKKLGEYLKEIKKVREFNSYEMFIVAHQINHLYLSPELENGTKKISKIVKKYLIFLTDLFFNYVQRKSDYFKAFLLDRNQYYKWAFKYLIESLETQNFDSKIIGEIEGIIKKGLLDKISVQIECPNIFYNPISYELFEGKNAIIKDFIKNIKEVE